MENSAITLITLIVGGIAVITGIINIIQGYTERKNTDLN